VAVVENPSKRHEFLEVYPRRYHTQSENQHLETIKTSRSTGPLGITEGRRPGNPSIPQVADFFKYLNTEKKLTTSTIEDYRIILQIPSHTPRVPTYWRADHGQT